MFRPDKIMRKKQKARKAENWLKECQNRSCSHTATQVCHHPLCTEQNGDLPLLLCRTCEQDIHRQPEYSGHLVLDIGPRRPSSSRPTPQSTSVEEEEEEEEDGGSDLEEWAGSAQITEDQVDGLFVKHNSKIRNKSPSDLERKLKRKKALKKKVGGSPKNGSLEAALAQIADPEGTGGIMDVDITDLSGSQGRRDSGPGEAAPPSLTSDLDSPITEASQGAHAAVMRQPIRRQSRVAVNASHFTLKFVGSDGQQKEDLEVVAAAQNTTLREALEAVLESRNLDINHVNVFIEKSRTPLPINSDTVFLAGNILEIKEKDDKDAEVTTHGKQRNTASGKSGSTKGSKQGRSSRRDSVGVVPLLLEPPPSKQRRGSLQLPFREHFFTRGGGGGGAGTPDLSKGGDSIKIHDDVFGSLRGRSRNSNLSIDDTFFPAISPQATWSEGTTGSKKNKSQKLSVVNLFAPSKDREKQDQLTELLSRYSSQGLPPLPDLLALGQPRMHESTLATFDLEPHWQVIVENSSGMTKKEQEHQEAVWELLNTEVSYITQIRVIIDVFQNCLINVQQEGFLNEIETERLFSNIDKIYECNCLFWEQYLLPVLLRGRESRQPLDPLIAREGFVEHFPILFQVYFKYFIEHKSCLEYAKSRMENSDLFKTFISWAEAQRQCNRLKLADILVKPMQRLLKYSLLLQAVLKHTEGAWQAAALTEMIQSVDKLCWAANTSLQRREDYEKLEAVRKTIDLYDAIEAPNDECAKIVQEYNGNFNLLAPMPGFREGQPRSLLSHSSLRMKEAQAAKVDVDCLLFTDLLLVCKSNKKLERFKIIRPPMRLDQLVVSELRDKGSVLLIYMNEYHVPIAAFTFHGDVAVVRAWLERFREAQKDFKLRKIEESAQLERLRSDAILAQEVVLYTPLDSIPADLDLVAGSSSCFPRSESMESADRFIPNLLLSPQGENAPGRQPGEIGRSGSTGDIYNTLSPPVPPSSSISATNLSEVAAASHSVFQQQQHYSPPLPNSSSSSSSLSSSHPPPLPSVPPPSLPTDLPSSAILPGSPSYTTRSHGVHGAIPGILERTSSGGTFLPSSLSSSTAVVGASSSSSPSSLPPTPHKPVQSCRSVPNITVGREAGSSTSGRPHGVPIRNSANTNSSSPTVQHRTVINVNKSKDATDSHTTGNSIATHTEQQQQQQNHYHQHHPYPQYPHPHQQHSSSVLVNSQDSSSITLDEDELARLKLAPRRSSRAERRYHTADAIQDLRSNDARDASIHKRLSWRADVQVADHLGMGGPPSKAMSSDSIRSCHSSSGVSSTASLHLNSDISEEAELSASPGSCEPTDGGGKKRHKPRPLRTGMFIVGDNSENNVDSNNCYDDRNNNVNNSRGSRGGKGREADNNNGGGGEVHTSEEDDDDDEEDDDLESGQESLRATTELVTMFNNSLQVSEMEDGIASVAVATDGFPRRLTHADILKMKKLKQQVLYDANIESSEV